MVSGLPAVWLASSSEDGEVGICAGAADTLFLSILEARPFAECRDDGLAIGFLGDFEAAARCEGVSPESERGQAAIDAALRLNHWLEARIDLRVRTGRHLVSRIFDQALVPLYFLDLADPGQALRRLWVPDREFIEQLAAGIGISAKEHASVRAGWI